MQPDYVCRLVGTFLGGGDHSSVVVDHLRVSLEGIHKDRHFGHAKLAGVREKRHHPKGTKIWNSRQWSAVSVEELQAIAEAIGWEGNIEPEWLGANLLLSGCPGLTSLPPMTRLVFPEGVTLRVYNANLPCIWPAETMEREGEVPYEKAKLFAKAALDKRGIVGWIESEGIIRPNDEVQVFLPQAPTEED